MATQKCPKCGQLLEVYSGQEGKCPKCGTYVKDESGGSCLGELFVLALIVAGWILIYVLLSPVIMIIDGIHSLDDDKKANGIILFVSSGIFLISIVLIILGLTVFPQLNDFNIILDALAIVTWIVGFICGKIVGRTYLLHFWD